MRIIQGVSYYTFGGFPWSVAVDRDGNAVHRQPFDVYNDGGVQVLDLRDALGHRISEVVTNDDGYIPTFMAPVRTVEYRWLDTRRGTTVKWLEWCREVTEIGRNSSQAAVLSAQSVQLAEGRGDLLRYNSFNGPDGVQVTNDNSGGPGLGDAFGWYSEPGATFSNDDPVSGTGCLKLQSVEGSEPGVTWFGYDLHDFTVSLFIRRPRHTYQGNVWWNAVHDALVISEGYGLHWQGPNLQLSNCLPPDTWVRVEARRQGTTCTLSVWSDDHLRQGTPTYTASGTGSDAPISDWWLEHADAGLFYDEWRIFTTASAGPFNVPPVYAQHQADTAITDAERSTDAAKELRDVIPPSQRALVNRCNGPDDAPVTVESSALYGRAFDAVSGAITYTGDAHSGDGAMSFPDDGTLPFVRWNFDANVETATYDVVLKVPPSSTNWGSVQFTFGGRALIDPNSILTGTLGGIYLQNMSNSGGVQVVAPDDVPIDQWFRVRLDIDARNVRCRVWFDPAGTAPDGDQTVSQDGAFTAVQDAAVVLIGVLCDDLVCIPGKTNYISQLQAPIYIAHRGGARLAPENSFEALQMCRARGVDVVEIDVHRTNDGGLVLMHDSTIDARTPDSGDPSNYSTASIERLRLDAGSWFGSTWSNDLKVPTLDDVLTEFGDDLILLIEVKAAAGEATGQMTVDAVLKSGLENRVIIGAFTRDQLDPALAVGIPCCLFDSDGAYDHAQLKADGVDYFGFSKTSSAANVDAAIAAGLRCIPYTVNRHHEMNALFAAHPQLFGMTTDDPWYLDPAYDHVIRNRPLFASRTYHDGQVGLMETAGWTHNPRGNFRSGPDNSIWVDTEVDAAAPNNGYLSVTLGAISQTYGTLPTSYDITFYLENISSPSTVHHGHIIFCSETDLEFNDDTHNVKGYVAMLRRSGIANLYYQDGVGGFTKLGADTDFTVNQAWLRVEVRPTTIAFVRTNGENGPALTTLQVTNNQVRGRYVSIGVRDTNARFTNITLRPL